MLLKMLSQDPNFVWKKRGSMERDLTERSDHTFLTGQVRVAVMPQAYNFFNRRLIFALRRPCPLFLCISHTFEMVPFQTLPPNT